MSKLNKILLTVIVILLIVFIAVMALFVKSNKSDVDTLSITKIENTDGNEMFNEVEKKIEEKKEETDDGRVDVLPDEELTANESSTTESTQETQNTIDMTQFEDWSDPDAVEDDIVDEVVINMDQDFVDVVTWYLMSPVHDEGLQYYTEELVNSREEKMKVPPMNELDGVVNYGTCTGDLKTKTVSIEVLDTGKIYKLGFELNEDGTRLSDIYPITEEVQEQTQETNTESSSDEVNVEE